ncbi:MAG: hypothetical protein H7Y38_21030, partial [Armatimonadetes bacterium]|nr:hypothetical protein [Armatimonadota bacterium]
RSRAQATACLSNTKQYALAIQAYTQDYDGNYLPSSNGISTVVSSHEGSSVVASEKGSSTWLELIHPYMKEKYLSCPTRDIISSVHDIASTTGYALNSDLNNDEVVGENKKRSIGKNEAEVLLQSRIVSVFDCGVPIASMNNTDVDTKLVGHDGRRVTPGAIRHNRGGNYAFADGHAKWFRPTAFVQRCSADDNKPCFTP